MKMKKLFWVLVLGLLLACVPVSASTGLVHHWNFDEGPDWHDDPFQSNCDAVMAKEYVSGADASLVNMGSANWASGRQFTGLEFDGTEEYLTVSTDLAGSLGQTASFLFWIQTTQSGGTSGVESPGIAGVENAGDTNDIQWGWIDSGGRIALSVGDTVAVRSADAVNDAKWHHIAILRNAGDGQCWLYVDGQLSATGTGPVGAITTAFSSLGRIEDTAGTDEYFQGRLDQVYIFNQLLDPATIQLNMDNHAPKTWDCYTDVLANTTCSTSSVLYKAYDPEIDMLTVAGHTGPSNGSVTYNGDGTFDYTPDTDFTGPDHFYVVITDGSGGFSTTNVYVDVLEPSDPEASKRTTNFTDFQAIQAGGSDISLSGWRVPRSIDWDGDGDNDLLMGHNSSIWRYHNSGSVVSAAFDAAVRVRANGSDISLSGNVTIALADMTGDAVDDLIAVDSSRKIRVYANTSSVGQVPVYTAPTIVQASAGGDFILPDQRFDMGDWDNDGKLDVITGTWASEMRVYLNVGTSIIAQFDGSQYEVLMNGAYNLYPRYFDVNRNNKKDLIRGENWGAIYYWFDSSASAGLGVRGSLVITDSAGANANINGTTDGAIVDFADYNGDGVYDLLIGGHAGSTSIFIAYGVAKTVGEYIDDIETIYDANPADLGAALEANDQALLNQLKNAERGIITHLLASTLDERQVMFDQMVAHVNKYSFLQMDHALELPLYHHVPSIVGQNMMTMHHMLPDTPTHRTNVADAVGLIGLSREIYINSYLHVGDNQQCSQGQYESIRDFMTHTPREIFPDSLMSIDGYFDWLDGKAGDGRVNTFTGGKNTFGSDTGWDNSEWAADLVAPIESVFGAGADHGDYFTFVMGHEATHSVDGYVVSRANSDLNRRWGQMLVYAGGPDIVAGGNGWIDWDATKSHFQIQGYWDGVSANWSTDWDAYWNTGPGSAWNELAFMRGVIGTFFLLAPQESLATQANHHAHSEGRLVAAIDRYRRGIESGIAPMKANINEVVLFIEFVSAGLNKVVMYDTHGVSTPYPRATYDMTHASLERNDKGYITSITVAERIYTFTLNAGGLVTAVETNIIIANDDSASVNADTDTVINVVANDSRLEGGTLTVTDVTQPLSGTVTNNGDGTVTYRSNPGYSGGDPFTYTVSSGIGSETANVIVNVIDVYETASHWKLGDGSGTTAVDSVGIADGTVSGATWTTGKVGGALSFDGANDKITFGTGPSLSGQVDFSVAAWIQTSSAANQVVIQQRNGDYNGEYRLKVNSNGTVNFMLYGNAAYQFDFSTSETVNDGQWHYITAVRDGTYGYIYIDGQQKVSASGTIRDLKSTIAVAVGADIRDNADYFNGLIDDIRICNKALSPTEVTSLYDSFSGLKDLSDLQALVSQWLNKNCGSCGGADLTGDGSVNLQDFASLAQSWVGSNN